MSRAVKIDFVSDVVCPWCALGVTALEQAPNTPMVQLSGLPSAERTLLVEGFNRGYRNEETRFPVCDSNTRQMEAELRARGVRMLYDEPRIGTASSSGR